jgi:hypothetical protein
MVFLWFQGYDRSHLLVLVLVLLELTKQLPVVEFSLESQRCVFQWFQQMFCIHIFTICVLKGYVYDAGGLKHCPLCSALMP